MLRSAIAFAFALAVAALTLPRSAAVALAGGSERPLHWAACYDLPNAECAILSVPIDPSSPNGARFGLRVARLRATNPVARRGVLVFIPGGPGIGIQPTVSGAERPLTELRRYYDVVTFDPRGVAESNPIRCAQSAVPKPPPPSGKPPTRAQFQAIASSNAALFRSCFSLSGAMMAHLSSIETAADIEQIRQVLTPGIGLVAYAGSYGTQYGATYLELYASHVKALVLDGLVDHSVDQPTDLVRTVLAVNESLERMSAWCGRTVDCALHGRNVGSAYDAAVRKAPVMKIVVAQMFAAGRDPQVGWPAITKMLAEVSRGDMTTLNALTKASSEARGSAAKDPQIVAGLNGLYAGVVCADFGPENDYDKLAAIGKSLAREAPRFVWKYWDWTPLAHSTSGALDCTGWDRPATNPPHVLRVGWHRNVMVANSAHDPNTTLTNAISVHKQIPGSVFLTADVDGHQSLYRSDCALHAMEEFLNDPKSVNSSIVCRN